MSPRRAHNLAIGTMLLAAVFAALVPMKGLIVCLGVDGHLCASQVPETEGCPCAPSLSSGVEHPEHDGAPCRDIRIRPTEMLTRESGSPSSLVRTGLEASPVPLLVPWAHELPAPLFAATALDSALVRG